MAETTTDPSDKEWIDKRVAEYEEQGEFGSALKVLIDAVVREPRDEFKDDNEAARQIVKMLREWARNDAYATLEYLRAAGYRIVKYDNDIRTYEIEVRDGYTITEGHGPHGEYVVYVTEKEEEDHD